MKWYEYIIMIIAIGLVILPFVLNHLNKKKGKSTCGCGCDKCSANCPMHKRIDDKEN